MTDYILVHGAWHGAWCWKRVRDLLVAESHRVFCPTLTGLGSRSHLLTRSVGLKTHIDDVANEILCEELESVVLVGHSYGGILVNHVADALHERVLALVYVDAFVPTHGKSLVDYLPDLGEQMRREATARGDGWRITPMPASYFAVNEADAAWVDRRCTDHPLSTFETPAEFGRRHDRVRNVGYVLAQNHDGPFRQFYDDARRRDWWTAEVASGHDVMIDAPQELAVLLLMAARIGDDTTGEPRGRSPRG